MMRAVDEVLDEIGAGDKPTLLVLNKVDELDEDDRRTVAAAHRDAVLVSALDRRGHRRAAPAHRARVPRAARARSSCWCPTTAARCCRSCTSVAGDLEREDTGEGVRVKARVPAAVAERMRPYELNGRPPAE